MIKWTKVCTVLNADGRTTEYRGIGTPYTIESRLRHIPHANRVGTWDHTTYFVLKDGKEIKELYSLRDAKEYAENYKED